MTTRGCVAAQVKVRVCGHGLLLWSKFNSADKGGMSKCKLHLYLYINYVAESIAVTSGSISMPVMPPTRTSMSKTTYFKYALFPAAFAHSVVEQLMIEARLEQKHERAVNTSRRRQAQQHEIRQYP